MSCHMIVRMQNLAKVLLPLLAVICLIPIVPSALALFLGAVFALTMGNPFLDQTRKLTRHLMAIAIVGMGAGMDLGVVAQVGLSGIGYTIIGITVTILAGLILGKIFKIELNTSILISIGTAICGGSAIAAVSPVIRAKDHQISIALGTVFMLNAVALFVFPAIGHWFFLSDQQFGLWVGLAIHDTSSVVGAAMQYGTEALHIGTTVKLARALWIVPLTLIIGYAYARSQPPVAGQKITKPWFILGFLIAAAIVTWIPILQPAGHIAEQAARRLFVMTLFLVGCGMTRQTLSQVGFRPVLNGLLLWIFVSAGTLAAINEGWIR